MEPQEDDRPTRRNGEERLLAHPDLAALGERLQIELDETLRAEQHAARVSAQRRSTIRDRLLMAEDRAEHLLLDLTGDRSAAGSVLAVGADHVIVRSSGGPSWIAIHHIVGLRVGRS